MLHSILQAKMLREEKIGTGFNEKWQLVYFDNIHLIYFRLWWCDRFVIYVPTFSVPPFNANAGVLENISHLQLDGIYPSPKETINFGFANISLMKG